MALSEYTCVRKLCLAPRHSGRDAFARAIIFLLRSVTKYYSLTLKITASVLHGLRKCVRELMVSDNRWLTLLVAMLTRTTYVLRGRFAACGRFHPRNSRDVLYQGVQRKFVRA